MAVLDGQLMPVADASIPVTDEGFVRGDGIFEALRVYGGHQYGLEHHLKRLSRSADGMRLRIDIDAIGHGVGTLIEAMGDADYSIRIMCTRGGHTIIKSEALHEFPESISLCAVQYRTTIVLDGLKTLSYGGNVLANRVAEENGADEALLITPEGVVLEGPTASLFWSPDGESLITPPLSEGILASITREVLLEKLDVEIRPSSIDEVLIAKEAFLCSSIREIQAINRVDMHTFEAPGPLTLAAKDAYAAEVEARLAATAANNR
jgi:branched-subunit amino acid aminotransferase/4-amino-4-deoxychorismate lyase